MKSFPSLVIAGTVLGATGVVLVAASGVLGQTLQQSMTELPHFQDVTAQSGINFRHSFGEKKLSSILEGTGSGCAWIDYNNDGYLDLYVMNGRYLPGVTNHSSPDGIHATNHLYRNNGNGTFTDVTAEAGVGGTGYGIGVTAGDYDNDGYEDLYVTNYGSATLYHNNGNGTFTDVTKKAGVENPHFGTGAAFVDYDRDGKLDLFVGNYLKFNPAYRQYYTAQEYPGPLGYAPEYNRLFHNNGNGTFTDVSKASGIADKPGRAMGVTVGDYDKDGWPDIYVANDSMPSFLYHNNHNGTFSEVASDLYVAYGQDGEASTAMGPIFGDINNDGWPDLFVSDAHYHRLYLNPGKPGAAFTDITNQSGVGAVSGQWAGWGDGLFDFDNDGWKDLFIVNGGMVWLVPQQSQLLRNNGNGTFTDVSTRAGKFFSRNIVSRGACFADYDNDGSIDAFVVTLNGRGILLHNTPPPGPRNNWLTIKLVGTRSDRDGYGARLEAVAGNLRQYDEAESESGYLSQSDPRPHFGLGKHKTVDRLTIWWPSGTVQTIRNIPADQILTVREPDSPQSDSKIQAAGGQG